MRVLSSNSKSDLSSAISEMLQKADKESFDLTLKLDNEIDSIRNFTDRKQNDHF